jgi:phosphohistidine phosphatase
VKRLYLLRHAKSSWDNPELVDRERPLAPRGRRAAVLVAEHLRREGVSAELVLCSSALRARETLGAILPALDGDVEIRIEGGLYAAGTGDLLERLQAVPDSIASVMLIGHNPCLQDLALSLATRGAGLERLREKFPTGALATLAVGDESWSALSAGDATLEAYVVPRELA